MKIKKYGNFKFQKCNYLYFGIMVAINNEYRFVTKIDRATKTWESEKNKRPYLFDSREVAQDYVFCMLQNYTLAYVVEIFSTVSNLGE